ncbi:hypothetical protein [Ruegeria atlantica]|nr:hypothetical protein [Ruegeria atlantica]
MHQAALPKSAAAAQARTTLGDGSTPDQAAATIGAATQPMEGK